MKHETAAYTPETLLRSFDFEIWRERVLILSGLLGTYVPSLFSLKVHTSTSLSTYPSGTLATYVGRGKYLG